MSDAPSPEGTPTPSSVREIDPDRIPYIPRRKSSIDKRHGSDMLDSTVRIVELDTTPKPLAVMKRAGWSAESVENHSRPNQSRPGVKNDKQPARLPSIDQISVSSTQSKKGHRVLSKLFSAFIHNGNPATANSALIKSFSPDQGVVQRLSGSTAVTHDSRRSSQASGASTQTSLVHLDHSLQSAELNCENPLRAPPQPLFSPEPSPNTQIQRYSSDASYVEDSMPPSVAAAKISTTLDVLQADAEKASMVWIVIEVTGYEHFTENLAASPRSQAFGPPYTNFGYLTNLKLDLSRGKGCSIIRVIGSETRESLSPHETWSIVVEVLAEPPARRPPMKAFSVQSRTSYHMIDHLHGMLAPSGPVEQDLLNINLTFNHVFFPPFMQCSILSSAKIECVSASALRFRPPYLRHRRKDYVAPQPEQKRHEQRDLVANKLLDLLEAEFRARELVSYNEATEILGQFFDGFEGALETRQRASMLLQTLDERSRPTTRRGRHVHPPSQIPSPSKSPRKGMELSRENVRLQDITNRQWPMRRQRFPDPRSSESAGMSLRPRPSAPSPPPLFSPRKRASVAELTARSQDQSSSQSLQWNGGSRLKIPYRKDEAHPNALRPDGLRPAALRTRKTHDQRTGKRRSSPTGAQVGSPRFYEDELDEANRIWKGMRESSCGAGTGGDSEGETFPFGGTQQINSEGEAEDGGLEDGREVVGAPWL